MKKQIKKPTVEKETKQSTLVEELEKFDRWSEFDKLRTEGLRELPTSISLKQLKTLLPLINPLEKRIK